LAGGICEHCEVHEFLVSCVYIGMLEHQVPYGTSVDMADDWGRTGCRSRERGWMPGRMRTTEAIGGLYQTLLGILPMEALKFML